MAAPAVLPPPSDAPSPPDGAPRPEAPAAAAQAWPYGWLLPVVGLLPLLLSLPNELQEIDPAQYAEVARRIAATGEWVKLYDAWGEFLNKPPMTMWLIALCIKLFGVGSVAARLPSLLAACLSVWAVSRIGARLWDRRTGFIAAGFLAASPALHLSVLDPKIDAVVTAFMCAAVLFAVEARRRRPWMWAAWASAGAGILTKGPVGLIVPALAILPEALRRPWGAADAKGGGSLWRRLAVLKPLSGPAVLCAVAAPWFVGMTSQWGAHGPYFILWEQTFARVLHQSAVYNDSTTPLYFVHTGAWAYLPATPLVAYALVSRAVSLWRSRGRFGPDERRVALWWLLLPLAGMSVASAKLPQYAFWEAPAAALLAAHALVQLSGRGRGWVQGFFAVLAVLVPVFMGAVFALVFPAKSAAVVALWLGLGLFPLWGLWRLRARLPGLAHVAAWGVGSLVAFYAFFHGYVHRELLVYQPSGRFAALTRQWDPRGETLFYVGPLFGNAVAFYAERNVRTVSPEDLSTLVEEGRAKVAVVDPVQLPELDRLGIRYERVEERPTYPTSRPRLSFLRASTRAEVVQRLVFVTLHPQTPAP